MIPVHIRYDGSFAGMLSAAAEIVRDRLQPLSVLRPQETNADLFATERTIITDENWSRRAWKAIVDRIGKSEAKSLAICHLAEDRSVDELLITQMVRVLRNETAASDPRDAVNLELRKWRKKIDHEAHHMIAFVRFQENTDGLWTSVIAPAYDVLPLIASHFKKRYADMAWMILDERRNYALNFDGQDLHWSEPIDAGTTDLPANIAAEPAPAEDAYRSLWKTYYHHVNIPGRRNLKLQMRHMAKRHWKHMVEMQG